MGDMADFFLLSEELSRYEEGDCSYGENWSTYNRRHRSYSSFTPYPKITREQIEELQDTKVTQACIRKWKNLL